MKDDDNASSQAAQGAGNGKPTTYFFFVGKDRFDTDQRFMTAGQIKARVAGVEPGDKLSLEGKGDEADHIYSDEEEIDLQKDKGPLRFTLVPSASFGA